MSFRNIGGTPGGLAPFLWGVVLASAGAYLLLQRVTVSSGGGWNFYGYNAFGLSLVPFFAGVGVLAYSGRNWLGWLLLVAGCTIILAGILMNLHIWFNPTSLFDTLLILAMLAAGVGLIARALKAS
jgi:multisubunit Na+/H+ antiporter MnhF subunit